MIYVALYVGCYLVLLRPVYAFILWQDDLSEPACAALMFTLFWPALVAGAALYVAGRLLMWVFRLDERESAE